MTVQTGFCGANQKLFAYKSNHKESFEFISNTVHCFRSSIAGKKKKGARDKNKKDNDADSQ